MARRGGDGAEVSRHALTTRLGAWARRCVLDQLGQVIGVDRLEVDQDGGVAVEVRRDEHGRRQLVEAGLLRIEVWDPYAEDRTGRSGRTQVLEVTATQRSLPGHRLAAHPPGALACLLLELGSGWAASLTSCQVATVGR